MKRLLSVIMCFFMLLGLFSCGRKNGADKKTPDGESTKKAEQTTADHKNSVYEGVVDLPNDGEIDEASLVLYDDVISLYRDVINICQNYVDSKDATEKYAAELGITDEKEKELFSELLNYAYLQYPGRGKEDYSSPHYKLSCGYALKDLNGDGVAELVLLNDDYTVIAIFSVVDGKPVLLDSYSPRRMCWIGGNGLLRVTYKEDYYITRVYNIVGGSPQSELVLEYALEEYYSANGDLIKKYYKRENGKNYEEITEAEYNALKKQYGEYLGESGAEATRKYSGLKFTSLFSEAEGFGDVKDNKISPEEAIEIARERFEYPPNVEGAMGTVIVNSIKVLNNPNHFYHVVLQAQRYERDTYYAGGEPYQTTYPEEIFVSTSSGFVWRGIKDVGQEFDAGNSPISIDEAERIASEYFGICDGDRPSPESEYVYRITAETADDGIYRVVRRLVYENGVVTEQVDKSYDIYVAAYTGCVFSLNGK